MAARTPWLLWQQVIHRNHVRKMLTLHSGEPQKRAHFSNLSSICRCRFIAKVDKKPQRLSFSVRYKTPQSNGAFIGKENKRKIIISDETGYLTNQNKRLEELLPKKRKRDKFRKKHFHIKTFYSIRINGFLHSPSSLN